VEKVPARRQPGLSRCLAAAQRLALRDNALPLTRRQRRLRGVRARRQSLTTPTRLSHAGHPGAHARGSRTDVQQVHRCPLAQPVVTATTVPQLTAPSCQLSACVDHDSACSTSSWRRRPHSWATLLRCSHSRGGATAAQLASPSPLPSWKRPFVSLFICSSACCAAARALGRRSCGVATHVVAYAAQLASPSPLPSWKRLFMSSMRRNALLPQIAAARASVVAGLRFSSRSSAAPRVARPSQRVYLLRA